MRISEICIERPVFATVLSLVVMLLGIVSYDRLSVREYPKIDEPVVTVTRPITAGASADIIESQVTKPLEDSLAGIEGVEVITSISRAERSQISVRFKLEREPDSAAADVRDRVSRVRNRLPDEVDEPVIAKVEADANPIIWLAFSSDKHSPLEVTDVANRIVKARLQTLPGAADVRVFGERKFAMRIWLDKQRLAAYRLTPADVEDALRRQNVEVPAGRIESVEREFSVVATTDLRRRRPSVMSFCARSTAIRCASAMSPGSRSAPAAERTSVRFKGRSAVSLGLIKQATANPLELSKALRAELRTDRGRVAGGHAGRYFLRFVGVHRPLDQVGVRHHRRSHRAGAGDHLLLPAQPARDADSAGDHPGIADRRLRHHVRARFHHQYADAAGAGAGHWSGGR
jgi:multidrug efflux pump